MSVTNNNFMETWKECFLAFTICNPNYFWCNVKSPQCIRPSNIVTPYFEEKNKLKNNYFITHIKIKQTKSHKWGTKCYKPEADVKSHQNEHVPSSHSQSMSSQTPCQSWKLFCWRTSSFLWHFQIHLKNITQNWKTFTNDFFRATTLNTYTWENSVQINYQ